mmetsp:Transcript_11748/g.17791  ORF Transcript_11748/g.17791 Transcript_11748/m.17791 type:complete len:291 (-) Transcript_11748:124-996(-)
MSEKNISCILSLKSYLRIFVSEREWDQYHTPRNLLLALCGECGELSEIMQWKNNVRRVSDLSRKDQVHLGEEISDVFIYTIRLSDLTHIDVAKAMLLLLDPEASHGKYEDFRVKYQSGNFHNVLLADIVGYVRDSVMSDWLELSPRDIVIRINIAVGELASIFSGYEEEQCHVGLPLWRPEHVHQAALVMARITALLACLALPLDLSRCIKDKLAKNSAKYPAHLVKGSSAKYTAYKSDNRWYIFSSGGFWTGVVATLGVVLCTEFVFRLDRDCRYSSVVDISFILKRFR